MPSEKAINSLITDVKEYLIFTWQQFQSTSGYVLYDKEGLFTIVNKFMKIDTV